MGQTCKPVVCPSLFFCSGSCVFMSSAHLHKYEFVWLWSNRVDSPRDGCRSDGRPPAPSLSIGLFPGPSRSCDSRLSAPHTQILCTHSCSLSLSYSHFSFIPHPHAHLNTVTHTHMHPPHTLPCTLIHSKAHSSHNSYNSGLPTLPSPPPPLSQPATLPLGAVSWNGLKELAPCTWSALFTRTCMWAVGRVAESPQSPFRARGVRLRSGRARTAFCLSPHTRLTFGIISLKTFFFSGLSGKFPFFVFFFDSDRPLHS